MASAWGVGEGVLWPEVEMRGGALTHNEQAAEKHINVNGFQAKLHNQIADSCVNVFITSMPWRGLSKLWDF